MDIAAVHSEGSTPAPRAPAARASSGSLAAGFEAMLLKEAFAPLAKAIGFYGDTVVAAASEAMLRGGLGGHDALDAALATGSDGERL